MKITNILWPEDRVDHGARHDRRRKTSIQSMTKTMIDKIPMSNSISELAAFWQKHDLTDFDDQLEEVAEPVFAREGVVLNIALTPEEADLLKKLAKSKGMEPAALVHKWVAGNVQTQQ